VTAGDDLRGTAYHEAGHAVAAHFVGIQITEASIVEKGDSSGHVGVPPIAERWQRKIEEADYSSRYRGFIDARTRRWVEAQVMFGLAGGLAHLRASPDADWEAGMGSIELTGDQAAALSAGHPERTGVHRLLVEGDLRRAYDLVEKVSGSDQEADAYLRWLEQRTRSLMRQPFFWPAVEAVAAALLERGSLPAKQVKDIIADCTGSVLRQLSRQAEANFERGAKETGMSQS
jgi:hypothetical protein